MKCEGPVTAWWPGPLVSRRLFAAAGRIFIPSQLLASMSLQRVAEQEFDLSVHTAQIVLGPAVELVQKLRGKTNQK